MSKQRILILSASVGSGHQAAARALEQAFLQHRDVEVHTQDVLELTNEAYAKLYADTYQLAARRAPWLLGWIYDLNDAPFTNEHPVRKLWDMLNAQPVVRFVKDFRPDMCVCTHFTPAGIIAQLMATGQLDTSLSVVTTDYDFQGMWLSPTFNRYFVAREASQARLIDLGVAADRVTVSGIPVDPRLGEPVEREAVLVRYELLAEQPVVVVSAGAVGGGPALDIVAQIMNMRHAIQCVVVCGNNERLRRNVEALTLPRAGMFRVLGFTDDMANLIRVATLFVGKSGGLTASECMAAGTPMVIVMPIPGQEERNADYLLEEGAAVRANDIETIDYKIDRLLDEPERLARLRDNARRIGRPDAARVIAATVLGDRRQPVQVDWRAQQEAARPPAPPRRSRLPWGEGSSVIALYDDERGVYLGSLTAEEQRTLRRAVPAFDGRSGPVTVERADVERMREIGANGQLCHNLETRIACHGRLRVRRTRVPVETPENQSEEP